VRIPRDMELPGDEVRIEREGERLVLSPVDKPSLASLLRRWEAIDDDIGHVEDLPIDDIRL
jgi:antitoxin VapB